MSENFLLKFSLTGISTQDRYRINLVGHIESESSLDKSKINPIISSPVVKYFSNKQLLDGLKIVEEGNYDDLRSEVINCFTKEGIKLLSFNIQTVDANYSEDDKSLDIDPNLESGGKKKGFLGRLFGKK